MPTNAELNEAFTTIDDLRDLKVALGRENARLNRSLAAAYEDIESLTARIAELEEAQQWDQMGDDL